MLYPSYLNLYETGALAQRAAAAWEILNSCTICPQNLAALVVACGQGSRLPIVYNCAGYENLETLKLLDGVVDIYLPDAKSSDNKNALRTSKMPHYVESNQVTLREMYRQVGPLQLDEEGIARRGLLIRHLVLPEDISGTREVLRWIAEELGPDTPVSLMDRYFPALQAVKYPVLNRRLTWSEYRTAMDALEELNLTAGYVQEDLMELDTTSYV